MLILLPLTWLLAFLYVLLMVAYRRGWFLQEEFVPAADFTPSTFISIIIPARNEETNIGKCIASILANDYPDALFEIIVIDDHSEDRTREVVLSFRNERVRCLRLSDYLDGQTLNSYKKKALETGIAHSSGELIVTTDADCEVGKLWLRHIAALYETSGAVMVVAPVAFTNNGNLVQTFQSLDFMTMQGITAAAYRLKLGNMSNGANLAFRKAAFYDVDGYRGVDHLASGDDYLLMMKLHRSFPERIAYLKSAAAIVRTAPQPDWRSFLQQRVRWASKSGKYKDTKLTAVLLVVYLFNVSLLLLFFAGFVDSLCWLLLLGILLLKTAVESWFLFPVTAFFEKGKELRWFALLQPLHILYIVSVGFLGFWGKYRWKGRSVR